MQVQVEVLARPPPVLVGLQPAGLVLCLSGRLAARRRQSPLGCVRALFAAPTCKLRRDLQRDTRELRRTSCNKLVEFDAACDRQAQGACQLVRLSRRSA